MAETFEIIINEHSRVPKYKQIVDSILNGIDSGEIKIGEKIPSINELSESCFLSRDTVEKAYKELRKRQIIESVKGKGYYISRINKNDVINIFFLINKPSTYKMMIYNYFVNAIGTKGNVEMYIYHCDETLFINSLKKNLGGFDYYVIMPHFRDEQSKHTSSTQQVLDMIEQIPKNKLLLLDNTKPNISGEYGSIFQDFEHDIYNALKEGLDKIKKYEKIILVYPDKSIHPYPFRIVRGFEKFCKDFKLDYEILDEIYPDMELQDKDIFITIRERDLVNLVKQIRQKNLELGKDIGIISYNETPLKELLGITVITTDFKAMGESAAYMILKNKKEQVNNVFKFIQRDSL
ncbi:GntR family transcriptional regulator [Chryseobacterium lathyri]|uniref:DNA-binding transcriptional regulator YhcF (GntR family) n=1 Tax=Chryseobacterium lathyri TaxID=395933 RepID=A0ABT9SK44_9FLAO|nr:GntR family transcriptional regulator [Chryseobacterium lathyri]MDP9959352.1 DNA-binding transcriptional regulator YhcF (GntR family) [Chryseobacterium lathyri]MDQ0065073.1 DNA-binding transcriptional regulator YhcF (GntR family) [Chryseobacterium lathyri]